MCSRHEDETFPHKTGKNTSEDTFGSQLSYSHFPIPAVGWPQSGATLLGILLRRECDLAQYCCVIDG